MSSVARIWDGHEETVGDHPSEGNEIPTVMFPAWSGAASLEGTTYVVRINLSFGLLTHKKIGEYRPDSSILSPATVNCPGVEWLETRRFSSAARGHHRVGGRCPTLIAQLSDSRTTPGHSRCLSVDPVSLIPILWSRRSLRPRLFFPTRPGVGRVVGRTRRNPRAPAG